MVGTGENRYLSGIVSWGYGKLMDSMNYYSNIKIKTKPKFCLGCALPKRPGKPLLLTD